MTHVTVLGGTGYTGRNLLAEAVRRGHEAVGIARSAPEDPVAGATYRQADLSDPAVVAFAVSGADAVVATLSPRGDLADGLPAVYRSVAEACADQGIRLLVVGGFSSLRPVPGAPRFAEGDLPEQFAHEAREVAGFLDWLEGSAPDGLDWCFVAPAMTYGAFAPGEATGRYRRSGEVALLEEDGTSEISGADFALALLDEVDHPTVHRGVLSVVH